MATERPPACGAGGAPDAAAALRILALLRADDLDAAIEAGLARFQRLGGLDAAANDALADARDRLLAAWAARERYLARNARLERLATERRRARAPCVSGDGDAATARPATGGTSAAASPGPDVTPPPRPALPATAAAALARARARVQAGRKP